jgi:hypothetical protein
MHKFSEAELDFILDDIKANGIVLEDLQNNLLDHICCIIEEEKPDEVDFHVFYPTVISRFFKNELKEIQDETEKLLTFKNYYAMKRTLKISGFISIGLLLLASILKTFHLPGAGFAYILGAVFFSLLFLPLMIVFNFKNNTSKSEKWVYSLGFILGIVACMGVLFKIMHWPYAYIMMRGSTTLFIFGFIPLFFITGNRDPEHRFKKIMTAVLMTACAGMIYSLFNLGFSRSVTDSMDDIQNHIESRANELRESNQNIQLDSLSSEQLELHKRTRDITDQIDRIKANLISIADNIPIEQAKSTKSIDVVKKSNTQVATHHFVNAQGELSKSALIKALDEYNSFLTVNFPKQKELLIKHHNFQLENSVLAVFLHELNQLQYELNQNEYMLLQSIDR